MSAKGEEKKVVFKRLEEEAGKLKGSNARFFINSYFNLISCNDVITCLFLDCAY